MFVVKLVVLVMVPVGEGVGDRALQIGNGRKKALVWIHPVVGMWYPLSDQVKILSYSYTAAVEKVQRDGVPGLLLVLSLMMSHFSSMDQALSFTR